MYSVKAKTIAGGYKGMAEMLLMDGKQVGNTHEIQNILMEVEDPMHNTYVPNRDSRIEAGLPVQYVLAELLWSGNGDNSLDFINRFSTFWNHLSEDGKTVNSAYGYIATRKFGFNQIDAIIHELKVHPNSRRATLNINVPRTPGAPSITDTKDEWCTMYLQFALRDGKVDMSASMRSNDVWLGFPYDYTYFLYIQWLIARGVGAKVGKYVHFDNSFHVYDNHYDDLKRELGGINNPNWENGHQKYADWTIDFDTFQSYQPVPLQYLLTGKEYPMVDGKQYGKVSDWLYEIMKPENTERLADSLIRLGSEFIAYDSFNEETQALAGKLVDGAKEITDENGNGTAEFAPEPKTYRAFCRSLLMQLAKETTLFRPADYTNDELRSLYLDTYLLDPKPITEEVMDGKFMVETEQADLYSPESGQYVNLTDK